MRADQHLPVTATLDLWVAGIRCAPCAEVLQNLERYCEGVVRSHYESVSSRVRIEIHEPMFRQDALFRLLGWMGLEAHELVGHELDQASRLQYRRDLKSLVLLGFTAGNMMILQWPLTLDLGLPVSWIHFFQALAWIMFFPAAVESIRLLRANIVMDALRGKISLDTPVYLAFFAGVLLSALQTWRGHSEQVYLDSVAMLLFLFQLGRFLLKQTQEQLTPDGSALLGGFLKSSHQVSIGSVAVVPSGERVVADGVLLSARAQVDSSWLNGESLPQVLVKDDLILAGVRNIGPEFLYKVTAAGSGSKLGAYLENLHSKEVRALSQFSDRVAARFTMVVLIVATLPFVVGGMTITNATRALAVLMVSCPCMFGFVFPFLYQNIKRKLLSNGLLIHKIEAFEQLGSVDAIVFDKTGTLTKNRWEVVGPPDFAPFLLGSESSAQQRDSLLAVIAKAEQQSRHPIGDALVRSVEQSVGADTIHHLVTSPVELSSSVLNDSIGQTEILAPGTSWPQLSLVLENDHVDVYRTETRERLVSFEVRETMRDGVQPAVQQLVGLGLEVHVCSGDSESRVHEFISKAKIAQFCSSVGARQSGEAKAQFINELKANGKTILFVGDGANDLGAAKAADVSIAVGVGALQIYGRTDLALHSESLTSLLEAILGARAWVGVRREMLLWTTIYNLIGVALAWHGDLRPWMAALLMPMSAIGAAVIGRARVKNLWRV